MEKETTIEAEVNSKSLAKRRHISHLKWQAEGERISNTAGGCFTLWEGLLTFGLSESYGFKHSFYLQH